MITIGILKEMIKDLEDDSIFYIEPGNMRVHGKMLASGNVFVEDREFSFRASMDLSGQPTAFPPIITQIIRKKIGGGEP